MIQGWPSGSEDYRKKIPFFLFLEGKTQGQYCLF